MFPSFMQFCSGIQVTKRTVENINIRFNLDTFLGAKLNVIVILPMDYPNAAPLFSLELDWHGKYERENSEEIRVSSLFLTIPNNQTVEALANL
jgi:hypothetical protein